MLFFLEEDKYVYFFYSSKKLLISHGKNRKTNNLKFKIKLLLTKSLKINNLLLDFFFFAYTFKIYIYS